MAKYSQCKNFSFVGYMNFKEENLIKDKQGSTWRKLSFGLVNEDGSNSQYVEVSEFGAGSSFRVKTLTEDGKFEDMEVNWSERNNKEVLDDVASFNKKYVLGEVVLHNHDLIEQVLKGIRDGKLKSCKFEDGKPTGGTKVSVQGQVKLNYYNGSFNQVYEFSRLSVVKEDEPCRFNGELSLVFTKGAVKDDKKNNRVIVKGYVYDYIKQAGKERGEMKLLPQTLIVQRRGLGEKIADYLIENMVADKGQFKAMRFDTQFVKGVDNVEPEFIKPTKEQEVLIELGLLTLDDIQEKAVGKKIVETRIDKLYAKRDYKKIVIDTPFKQKDVFVEEDEEESVYEDSIFNTSDDDDETDEVPFDINDIDLPF